MARYKWRIHHGMHIQNDTQGVERLYRQGDVFESDLDLNALNGVGMSPKFERLEEVRVTQGERMPESRGTVDERMQEVKRHGDERSEVQKASERGFHSDTEHPTKVPQLKGEREVKSTAVKDQPPPKNLNEYSALLDKMSVEELKAHAAEEEVDLKNATTKDQIIRALRTSAKG